MYYYVLILHAMWHVFFAFMICHRVIIDKYMSIRLNACQCCACYLDRHICSFLRIEHCSSINNSKQRVWQCHGFIHILKKILCDYQSQLPAYLLFIFPFRINGGLWGIKVSIYNQQYLDFCETKGRKLLKLARKKMSLGKLDCWSNLILVWVIFKYVGYVNTSHTHTKKSIYHKCKEYEYCLFSWVKHLSINCF